MTRLPEKIDSKFRFVLVAARRAEQLMRGGRPHFELPTAKHTRVAQQEIHGGAVHWDYGPPPGEEEAAEEAESAEGAEETEEEEVH